MEVKYIEKEMKKLQKNSDKILNEYSEVEGLESVLNDTLVLINSESFNMLTKNIYKYLDEFNMKNLQDNKDKDSLREKFPIFKYSLILKSNKHMINKLLHAAGFGDTIVYSHIIAITGFITGILYLKKKNDVSDKEIYSLTDKVMVSLDDFNQNSHLISFDENFFKNLKDMVWDKKASKLFSKIVSIQLNIVDLILDSFFSSSIAGIYSNYNFTLTMLVACSAVNGDRDQMEYEDVICAFRTFYKLLDADIDDLI